MIGRLGELDVSDVDALDGSKEFARMWFGPNGSVTCIVDPRRLDADPFVFGLAMVDCIKHASKAYAQATGIVEEQALARIFEGFDGERAHPTDDIRQISPTRKSH